MRAMLRACMTGGDNVLSTCRASAQTTVRVMTQTMPAAAALRLRRCCVMP